ncbi:hypothetical protein [Pectobacterium polaris]|uniref:hypothetical protein n=1 Tax=Pectobacterium polaris TaxID=2042057 RepID=UPI0039C8D28D
MPLTSDGVLSATLISGFVAFPLPSASPGFLVIIFPINTLTFRIISSIISLNLLMSFLITLQIAEKLSFANAIIQLFAELAALFTISSIAVIILLSRRIASLASLLIFSAKSVNHRTILPLDKFLISRTANWIA